MPSPIPINHGIVFDRRLPEALLTALSDQGPLAGLGQITVDAGPACAADLGLRGDVKSLRASDDRPRTGRVTLYVGTTMAAHLHARTDGRVKLVPQQGTQLARLGPRHVPFNHDWSQWQHPQDMEKEWPTILGHLLEVVNVTPPGRLKEGRIQASLTRLATDFAIVDREVVLSHQNEGQRSAVRADLRRWVDQIAADELPPGRPKSFGNKLDALGVDKQGRLLVIEVKPASELNGTAWTPLQVSVYQYLFSAWLKSAPVDAVTVISGMLDDRVRLGLLDAGVRKSFKLKPELEPRPVIALGCDQHHRLDLLYGRFRAVLKACQAGGAPLAELAVWSVGAKSIDRHPKLP